MPSDCSWNTGDNIASQQEDATVSTTGVHQPNKEVQLVSKTKKRIVSPTYLKDLVWRSEALHSCQWHGNAARIWC